MQGLQSNWRIGLPLALITAFFWGAMPLVLKGLLAQLDPVTLAWCRQIGCGVLMAVYFSWRRNLHWSVLMQPGVLGLVVICTLGMTMNSLLFNIGLQYVTPSTPQVLGQLGPVLVLLGAVLIFKESFTRQQWFGAALAVSGLLVFFHDRLSDLLHMSGFGYGMILLAIAPFFWAAYALAQKQLNGRLDSQHVLMIAYIVGNFALLPLAEPSRVLAMNELGWMLLVGAVVIYLLSYITLGTAMAHWEASRVSAMITLSPLLTLLLTHVLVIVQPNYLAAEPHDLLSWCGAGCVVAGSFLAALPRRSYAVRAA